MAIGDVRRHDDHRRCGLYVYPGITFLTFGYVVGLSIIFDGVIRIINWFEIHKEARISGWVLASTIGVLVGIGIILSGVNIIQFGTSSWMVL